MLEPIRATRNLCYGHIASCRPVYVLPAIKFKTFIMSNSSEVKKLPLILSSGCSEDVLRAVVYTQMHVGMLLHDPGRTVLKRNFSSDLRMVACAHW